MEALRNPLRLIQAARTALALVELVHNALWQLYPDELIAFNEQSEDRLLESLLTALQDLQPDLAGPTSRQGPSP